MNLIICITPLQSLIAQQIIRQSPNHPASHWACLYLPYGDNPKHRYYYGQLQSLCQTAAYIELKNKGLFQQLTTLQHINKTLKQLRNRIAYLAAPHMTISIGVAERSPDDDSLSQLIHRADMAMYQAKRQGRNQTILAPTPNQPVSNVA